MLALFQTGSPCDSWMLKTGKNRDWVGLVFFNFHFIKKSCNQSCCSENNNNNNNNNTWNLFFSVYTSASFSVDVILLLLYHSCHCAFIFLHSMAFSSNFESLIFDSFLCSFSQFNTYMHSKNGVLLIFNWQLGITTAGPAVCGFDRSVKCSKLSL